MDATPPIANAGSPIEDELLVLRCRQGDAAALERLLGRWQEPLWRHALRLTGTDAAAWDVLQEAFLAIACGIRKLEDDSAFAVWAYRIVGNKSHDWLRQHIRRREREHLYAEQQLLDDPNGASPATAGLREVLSRMPEADRALLTLKFEDGLSIEELAHMLGVPEGTVKSRLHSAKQRLRKLMEKEI